MASVVIFGGGIGSRMKLNVPKQFMIVDGRPILSWTIDYFEHNENIDKIVLVILKSYIEYTQNLVKKENFSKVKRIVAGGVTGQESIYNGLIALREISSNEDDIVFVHDAVRPIITNDLINQCAKIAIEKGNAIAASQAIETVAICDENKQIQKISQRSKTWILKAPQVFRLNSLLHFHEISKEKNLNFVDSADMMQHFGEKLNVVECDQSNIKITTAKDKELSSILLNHQKTIR